MILRQNILKINVFKNIPVDSLRGEWYPIRFQASKFGDLPVKSVLAKTDASTEFYDNYQIYAYIPCL